MLDFSKLSKKNIFAGLGILMAILFALDFASFVFTEESVISWEKLFLQGAKTSVVSANFVNEKEILDIPETEFLDNYFKGNKGFKTVALDISSDQPVFARNNKKISTASLLDSIVSLLKQSIAAVSKFEFVKAEQTDSFEIKKTIEISGENNQELETKYNLSGIKISTQYKRSDGISLATGSKPIKQAIKIENNNKKDITFNLKVKHVIRADKINWDGNEYQITQTPQAFLGYRAENTINPADYDITPEQLGLPEDRELPTFVAGEITRGTSISFNFGEEDIDNESNVNKPTIAIYDWSDIPQELNPEVSVILLPENSGWLNQKGAEPLSLLVLSLTVTVKANSSYVIDPNYDLSSSANYNIRYDGVLNYDSLGVGIISGDVNGDSHEDLLVTVLADYNGRTNSQSIYVIFSTKVATQSGNINLGNSSNYNIRYDGAAEGDRLGAAIVDDVNGDSSEDIILTATNANSSSGSVYVIFSTKVATQSGNIDMSDSDNYSIRYDGASASDGLGKWVNVDDVNGDSYEDLILLAHNVYVDCYVYVIFSTKVATQSGNIDMSDSDNYNIKYYGIGYNDYFYTSDVNGDSDKDLIITSSYKDYNSRSNSGSIYVIFSTKVATQSGDLDITDSDNYSIRYDGANADDYLGGGMSGENDFCNGDVNGDSYGDLIISSPYTDYNSRSNSGSIYVIFSTKVATQSGNIDMSDSDNYNIRYDGATEDNYLLWYNTPYIADVNGDSYTDLIINAEKADYNSKEDSGSIYVIFSTTVSGQSGSVDLSSSSNYDVRYDGPVVKSFLEIGVGDVNGDSKGDLLISTNNADYNNRNNSGSVYVIFSTTVSGHSGSKNLSSSSNYNVRYDGAAAGDGLGVFLAKDVDGDSYGDLVMGAPNTDYSGRETGSLYVLLFAPLFDQAHFQIFQDDAGLNAATQYVAEDTNYNVAVDTNFRVRFEIANTGNGAGNITRRLEYRYDSGSWTQVTTTSGDARIIDSSQFSDGDATTTRLTATGTFTAGQGKDTGSDTTEISLGSTYYTEDEYALKFQADAALGTYEFRITNAGVALDSYSETPSITLSSSFDQKHFQIFQDDDALNAATAYAAEDTDYNVSAETIFRIRFEVANTGAGAGDITRRLEYQEDGGVWTQMLVSSGNARIFASSNFTDGDATTTRLTATGTFTAGQGKDTGSDTTQISLGSAYYVEDEYSIRFESGASGSVYKFRITNAGTPLGTYTKTPTIALSESFDQKHFQIFQDDAALNSATQYAAEDTNYNIAINTNFRLRIEIANTGTSAGYLTRRLEFSEDGGAWTQITTDSNNVRLVDSSEFTDADATTTRLTATGTFMAGQGKDTGSDTTQILLTNAYFVEDEYALKFQSGAAGSTYQFRITDAGLTLDTYSVTPEITATTSSLDQKHFQIFQDDADLNAATQYAAEDTNYNVSLDTNFRLRFEVANTGTAPVNITRRLEFSEDGGAWTQITTGTNNVRLVDSSEFSDGGATTNQLTAVGTFTAGQGKDTGSDTTQISLTNAYFVEDEYALKFESSADGHYYQFRISNAGSALDTYTKTPLISFTSITGSESLRIKGSGTLKVEGSGRIDR